MNPCIYSSRVWSKCCTSNIYRIRRRLEIASNIQSAPLTHFTCPPPPPPPCHVIRKWKIWVCNMKLGCLLQELIVFWEMTSCRHFGETLCFRSQIASETLGKKTPLQGWGVVTFQKTGPSLTTVTYSNTKFWPCDSSSICCKKTEAVHNVVLHIAGQANVRVMQSWGAFA